MDAEQRNDRSSKVRFMDSEYGLAITYWALYFIGATVFFVFGSQAINTEAWSRYVVLVVGMLAYTVILIVGIRVSYKGPQLWKVMSRTSSLFMISNILLGISTLGFVY